MLIKDQLKIRMEELGVNPVELGRRLGVTGQTVRCWINGRNFPNKKVTSDIERELSFKLDYSEGAAQHTNTVSDSIQNSAINALVAINKLPAPVQLMFHKLAEAYEQQHSNTHREAAQFISHQHAPAATSNYAQQRPAVGNRSTTGAPKTVKAVAKPVVAKPVIKRRQTANA